MATQKVKGEAVQTLEYTPGERLAESKPPDEGPATLMLGANKNLAGVGKGWKAKPGKYPNRLLWFKVLDTEDEVSGKEKEVRELISLSPGALRRGAMHLAQASQYPLKLTLGPANTPNHPSVRANAVAIDRMLFSIKEQELVLRGEIYHEEYNGAIQGNVKWLPPEELMGEEEGEAGDAEAAPNEDDVFGTVEETEEPAAEETEQAEETEGETEVEEPAAEEAIEEEPAAEEPEDAEFEPIPPPKKKAAPAPVSKVAQPGQKKVAAPAAKKPAAKAPVKGKKK